jgi:mono/diheme cytochrome c family protein
MIKRVLKGIALVAVVLLVALGGFVAYNAWAYAKSMDKVYDVPLPTIARSTDPAVIARGKHIVESIGGCASGECHGPDLAGGKPIVMGPLGTITAPNITAGASRGVYTDAELARLLLHGIKRDGKSVQFMPSQDMNWLPDEDIQAVISYVPTVPAVQKPDGKIELGLLAKVLDRRGMVTVDVARTIDHSKRATAPTPAPTAAYGAFLSRSCLGCHGEHLTGGPIPGAPKEIPVPKNITLHETGIKGWTYADFDRLLVQGLKKDGAKLDAFMPVDAFGKMNDVEKQALWAYLESLPPQPFGGR